MFEWVTIVTTSYTAVNHFIKTIIIHSRFGFSFIPKESSLLITFQTKSVFNPIIYDDFNLSFVKHSLIPPSCVTASLTWQLYTKPPSINANTLHSLLILIPHPLQLLSLLHANLHDSLSNSLSTTFDIDYPKFQCTLLCNINFVLNFLIFLLMITHGYNEWLKLTRFHAIIIQSIYE